MLCRAVLVMRLCADTSELTDMSSIILAYFWDIPFPCLLVVLILSYPIDYWAKIINNAMVIPRPDIG